MEQAIHRIKKIYAGAMNELSNGYHRQIFIVAEGEKLEFSLFAKTQEALEIIPSNTDYPSILEKEV